MSLLSEYMAGCLWLALFWRPAYSSFIELPSARPATFSLPRGQHADYCSSSVRKLQQSSSAIVRASSSSSQARRSWSLFASDPSLADRNGKENHAHYKDSTSNRKNNNNNNNNPLVDFSSKKEQLWLDLRETSLFPHEALRFLQEHCAGASENHAAAEDSLSLNENIDETILHLIDGVLVSQDMFERIALQESQIIGKPSFVLLYETDDEPHGGQLIANSASAQMSIPVGKIVTYSDQQDRGNETIDPMLALDIVVDQKKWLLLDSKHRLDSEESTLDLKDQVESLLQFVSASSMVISSREDFVSASGLIVPGLTSQPTRSEKSSLGRDTGGVAIVCPNQSTFLMIDSLLAEFRSSTQTTTTTESGLLVPVESDAVSDDESSIGSRSFSLPATALTLPLDLRLWKTALVLRQMVSDAGDAEIDDLLQP